MTQHSADFLDRRPAERKSIVRTAVLVVFLLGQAAIAWSQISFPLTVSGKTATATVQLPGAFNVDVSIVFEEVVGLNPGSLQVSAGVLSPLDLLLLGPRLPGKGLVTIPGAFPVLLLIGPTPSSSLSFAGVVTVSLHSHNLSLNPISPFGLYSAYGGGAFQDITRSVGIGSYRVDGSGGGFSEFVIAADKRPIDVVIDEKFAALQSLLTAHAGKISAPVFSLLQKLLSEALVVHDVSPVTAIGVLKAFSAAVKANSGQSIPDVWRAHDTEPNVAGLLRAASDTLIFSLILEVNGAP